MSRTNPSHVVVSDAQDVLQRSKITIGTVELVVIPAGQSKVDDKEHDPVSYEVQGTPSGNNQISFLFSLENTPQNTNVHSVILYGSYDTFHCRYQ